MRKIRESIEIAAPVESVFEFVADFRNSLRWMHGFDRFEALTNRTRGHGARARVTGRLGGIPLTTELEIVEFVPNRRLVSASSSGVKSISAWLFEPTEQGTRVSFVAEYEIPRGAIGHILNRLWLRRELADHTWRSLKNLKRVMEAGNSDTSGS
ncbi:MAG: SRPBCC family protein [Chloroflexota bacterium]